MTPPNALNETSTPAELVRIQAAALLALAKRLDGAQGEAFDRLASVIVGTVRAGHKVVLTGLGKSGLIARKIVATFLSTGTAAQFLHPTEALHGDLGVLQHGDLLLALSYSGETAEIQRLLPILPRLGVTLFSFCGSATSTLAKASYICLDVSVEREACTHQLAPTASSTTMLALGDALAIEVSRRLEFQPIDFAALHPGGELGRQLSRKLAAVRDLMHTGAALPMVPPTARMPQIIHEMSAKRLGLTTVQSDGKLVGVLSDGDLRRLLERNGPHAFHKTAAEVMNTAPRTIAPERFASDALSIMEEHKITALVVTETGGPGQPVLGVVHLHDLWDRPTDRAEEQDAPAL